MNSSLLKMFDKALIALILIKFSSIESEANDIEVCLTELGCVHGTHLPGYHVEQFEAFLGVPFAQPPIGPLRFKTTKNPIPIKPWNDILKTQLVKPDCVQRNYLLDDSNVTGEEDCLYMNIYRPKRLEKLLPVMIYIFDGGFFTGSPSPEFLDPSYFMDTQEVILVIANYRLGPFGFLSTGTVEMPGNLGFKDQQLALKWVQANIASFGGNPQAVTLFGHSVGASSVHFHMLSEGSRGLFHAAILASGNALGPYADVIKEPYHQVLEMAESLGIVNAADMDIKDLVEKLQSFDAYTLITAGDVLKTWHRFPLFNFRPTIEQTNWPDAFLTDLPERLLKNSKTFQVPTLQSLVSNRGEGAVYTLRIWTHPEIHDDFNANFNERLWSLMELPLNCSSEQINKILNSIVEEYFGCVRELNNSTIGGFSELFGDMAFYYPFWKSTKISLAHALPSNPLYVLKFNYNGPKSYAFLYNGGAPIQYGVVHLDELSYLFRSPALFEDDFVKGSANERLVNEFVQFYVDFAKNLKVANVNACTEEMFNSRGDNTICDYVEFLNHVDTGYAKVIHNGFNTERMEFWEKLLEHPM